LISVTTTADYLPGAHDVVRAGRELLGVIDRPGPDRQDAVDRLVAATHQQEAGVGQFRTFMFSALESPGSAENKEQLAEELLGNITFDIRVAGLLITGGDAVGEAGRRGDKRAYEEALVQLNETRTWLEDDAAAATYVPGAAGAPDQPTAVEQRFHEQATATVTTLVEESRAVLRSVVANLKDLDPVGVLEAFAKVGSELQQLLPKVGRLLRLGLRKLEQAIHALQRLFGAQALAEVSAAASHLWKRLVNGGTLDDLLSAAIGAGEARAAVDSMFAAGPLETAALRRATTALVALEPRIRTTMGRMRHLVRALGAAVAAVLILAVVVVQLASVVPVIAAIAYALAVAATIVLARDFADSGRGLGRIKGVRSIVGRLAP
jgi:hypothetical protein